MRFSRLIKTLLVIFFILGGYNYPQQFPVGFYSGKAGGEVLSLAQTGANMLIHYLPNGAAVNNQSGFSYVIPANAYSENERIHYYSGGYLRRWKPKEGILFEARDTWSTPPVWADTIGLKLGHGELLYDSIAGDSAAYSGSSYSGTLGSFIFGPSYKQNYRYDSTRRQYNVNPNEGNKIKYIVRYHVRTGEVITGGSSSADAKICIVSVVLHNQYVNGSTAYTTLKEDTLIYSDFNNSNYHEFDLEYDYSNYITQSQQNAPGYGPLGRANYKKPGEVFKLVEFRVKWLGNRELYVKEITVFDDIIGIDLLQESDDMSISTTARQSIKNYCTDKDFSAGNIAAWYGLDEPNTIDSYEPYRLVNKILKEYTPINQAARKPLMTTFCPYYETTQNYVGNYKFPLFMRLARPDTLIFDFYPINWQVDQTGDNPPPDNHSNNRVLGQFSKLRELLSSAKSSVAGTGKKVFYTGQVHSFVDPQENTNNLTQPTAQEFSAASMLALAYGVKGLLFYSYYNDPNNPGNKGLEGGSASLKEAADTLIRRLKGEFGNKLLKLNSLSDMLRVYYGTIDGNKTTDSTQSCPISLFIQGSGAKSFHAGLFSHPDETNSRYMLLVNEFPTGTGQTVTLKFCYSGIQNLYGSTTTIRNLRLTNVNNCAHISVSPTCNENITMPCGEGILYKINPVVQNGGTITASETISSATTLNGAMTMATGCTLTVNSAYTINSDITLEGTGKIQFGYNGNIVLNNGAKIINSSWSSALLRGNASQKPKLIWSPYTGSGTVTGYEIYRKFETSNFDYLASVGASQYSYTDQTITIAPENMSGPDACYYVKAVFSDNTKSPATNTVSVMVYAQKKKAETEAVEKSLEFKCDNYPNPFNPATTISYQIPSAEKVTLKIFDVLGKEIITLVDGYKEAGSYHAVFDASKFPSGVYIYRLEAGKFIESKKMVFAK